MTVGDISNREITFWGHVGSSLASQRPVETSQAKVLPGWCRSGDSKPNHTPGLGKKVLN